MINSPEQANTLLDVLDYWAEATPDNEVLRFYPQGEGQFNALTFKQFRNRCLSIAETIEAYQGQRAILFYQSGLEFLEALFGCFYAGVIAVPAHPPRRNHNLERLQSLINDSSPSLILSAEDVIDKTRKVYRDAMPDSNLPWFETNNIATNPTICAAPYQPKACDIAFLQYTSGSTGLPKGVMVSHHNLITNVRMAKQSFNLPEQTRCVSWLPLFHDMGLIGAVMMPLYWGAGALLMPPAAFLQKPSRWLALISDAGKESPIATAAPNFAYQMCLDTINDDDIATYNFSNWVFALNGAETIRAETVKKFNHRFAKADLNPKTIGPSYGMAECTLLATTRQGKPLAIINYDSHELEKNRLIEKADGKEIISSGSNCEGQTLRIVDPDKRQVLPDGSIGEIWLKGEHIAQGYWQQKLLTEETFLATTTDNEGPFLRTGDLGCIYKNELFITGRAKDLLIIRGRNHYPQDIEYTASNAHPALNLDSAAAFTIEENNEEALVLVQEILRTERKNFDAEGAAQAVRNAIAREHGIEVKHIIFIRFNSLAKTSSGKIQHLKSKKQFLANELNIEFHWKSDTTNIKLPKLSDIDKSSANGAAIANWIQNWLAAKAGIVATEISLDEAIDDLGIDSVDLIQLSAEVENWLQKPIDHSLFFELDNIQATADAIADILADDTSDTNDDEEIEGFI